MKKLLQVITLTLALAAPLASHASEALMTAEFGAVGYTFGTLATEKPLYGVLIGTALGSAVGATVNGFEYTDATIAAGGAAGAFVIHHGVQWLYQKWTGSNEVSPVAVGVAPQRGGAVASLAVNF